ncbi:MAG: hypothetical protein ACI9OJ_002722 [Myxococcota bacterium]|jgi:hypothetical protein
MRASVTLKAPDDRTVELSHGDLIGRLQTAALHIADPRVSEAHAMISLRGSALHLLALRGRFTVHGKPLARVKLLAGMEVHLADGLVLSVESVVLPPSVLAVRVAGMQETVISGVCSLFGTAHPELKPGFHPSALAHLWMEADSVLVRQSDAPDLAIFPGGEADVGSVHLKVVEMGLQAAGEYVTCALGGIGTPLEVVTRYDTVHIYRENRPAFRLSGISARIVSELVSYDAPASWATVAAELWPQDAVNMKISVAAEATIRARWDVNLGRLRKKLKAAGIRPDLVRSDGTGNVELSLEKHDVLRDES